MEDDVAARDVAALVALADVPERGPGADVVPADVGGDDGRKGRVFHDAVVDRDRGGGREGAFVEAREVEIALGGRDGLAHARQQLGLQALRLFEERRDGEEEHAAVPGVLARREVLFGARLIGLLHELGEMIGAGNPVDGVAPPEVAEAGLGMFGNDAEGGESTLARDGGRRLDRVVEGFEIADHVVRGQGEHDGVRVLLGDHQRRGDERGRGVPGDGLEDDRHRVDVLRAQLFGDDEAMVFVA